MKFTFEAKKKRADEIGKEESIRIDDYMTFAVFGTDGEELCIEKHHVDSERETLEFVVDKVPQHVGIDPYYFLIDKDTGDNIIAVTRE